MKSKPNPQKPRASVLHVHTLEVRAREIEAKLIAGVVHEGPPHELYLSQSYERGSGKDKVVLKIPCFTTAPQTLDQLLDRFAAIIGVDTSRAAVDPTTGLPTNDLCVTGISVWRRLGVDDPAIPAYVRLKMLAYVFRCSSPDFERVGWRHYLEDGRLLDTTLILVDSYLDAIPKINNKSVAVDGHLFLPDGCLLGYASADADAHELTSLAIRQADEIGRSVRDDPSIEAKYQAVGKQVARFNFNGPEAEEAAPALQGRDRSAK